jgi:hypothetical protein
MLIAYTKFKGFPYSNWFTFCYVGAPNSTICFSSTGIISNWF